MKVLFIGKYHYFENLPVMFLAGFLKKHGYECVYLDLMFERNYIKAIKKIKPQIIAFTVVSGLQTMYLDINRKIKKEYKCFSIFGGPHCTVYPETIYEEGVDAICRGEGELPLLELVEKISNGQNKFDIKNLWIKDGETIYKNELRNLVENIDEVSFPDRSVFDHYDHYRKLRSRTTICSRGCPYVCTYCYNNIIMDISKDKGKYVRIRSVENVISELKKVKENYKPKRIKFMDDTFILNKKWGLDFCELYEKEIALPFVACIRVNIIDEEIIIALKKAGCISVNYGVECGDEEYRNTVLKRRLSNEQLVSISHTFAKHGIKTVGLNMLGLPGETIDDCIKTLKFNIECKVSFAHTVMFSPLPNTELCNYAIQNNYFNGDFANLSYNYMFTKSVLNMKDSGKIKRLQYLFSTIVAFPFMLPFLKILIRLPFTKLYQPLFFLHRVYNHLYITKQLDWQDIFVIESGNKKR